MEILERPLQEISKSLLVTLPKSWADSLSLKKGSKVKIMVSDDARLIISPEFSKKGKNPSQAAIDYDSSFKRKFFREYFKGNEKIIINIKGRKKEGIYSFLKKFMNVQIIDDSAEKIIVKCFEINQLSIEECLRRMHFLSKNMIEEALLKNDEFSLKEMDETLARFYYLLVMQIRRFISEGKFAQENQISLIRAVDLRMVAEKIERIADLAKSFKKMGNDSKNSLKMIYDYYLKSFECFISENYEKSLALWINEDSDIGKLQSKLKGNDDAESMKLLQILDLSKSISLFVR